MQVVTKPAQLDRDIATSRSSRAIAILKRAARYIYDHHRSFVAGGCADVSEILAAFGRSRGYDVRPVYGTVTTGGEKLEHAWLSVQGRRFDPTWWLLGERGGTYKESRGMRKKIYSLVAAAGERIGRYVAELDRNVKP